MVGVATRRLKSGSSTTSFTSGIGRTGSILKFSRSLWCAGSSIGTRTDMGQRVAIVHDWLLHHRGGEKVLEALCELYPEADLYTLFYRPEKVSPVIKRHRIFPSFLNRLPWVEKYYRHLLPLYPLAVERWDLGEYDLVISSSHCAAKGVIVPPHARHICYLYTPMRYAWDQYWNYFGKSALEPLMFPFLHYLRIWDVSTSRRVDQFLTL